MSLFKYWKENGKKAGQTGVKAADAVLDGFVLKVNEGGLSGTIKYRAFIQGKKWAQGWKASGDTIGVKKSRIEALQIKLTGDLAKKYINLKNYVAVTLRPEDGAVGTAD